jgi:reverse gyrase
MKKYTRFFEDDINYITLTQPPDEHLLLMGDHMVEPISEDIQLDLIQAIETHRKDSDFIGRFIYTELNNAILNAQKKHKDMNADKIKKAILKYLGDRW